MSWAVEAQDLSKTIDGVQALKDVTLHIPTGAVFGLIGPNGAGKTTLIRLMLGIWQPTAGQVLLFGNRADDPTGIARQGVGYVPDIPNWPNNFRVEDVLKWHRLVYRGWDEHRAGALLEMFRLRRKALFSTLSKGQKMQVSLSCALATHPRLLILDEPTNGLDPVVRREFLQLLVHQVAEDETTMLFSTHLLEDLQRVADHIGVLFQGRLLLSTALADLWEEARKILVVFRPEAEPDLSQWPEVWRVEHEGRLRVLWVGGAAERVMERIRALEPVYWEAVQPALDDLFVEMMRREGYTYGDLELE
ncbi:MAG: ABC transporter ATP-binding protein [Kyrpidia tusciae]|nr:ABC transporter ATP-binding protein [Kyrpidia tusciae]MBE3553296.1 ABC transporter ATP-binding protein [Kyrpidia tusciae]